jgi:hypothetical protein
LVKGKVVDADSNFSMQMANVFLIEKTLADSVIKNKNYKVFIKNVLGNVVDKDGHYIIKNVPYGEYVIKCYFIGYKSEVDTIKISEK